MTIASTQPGRTVEIRGNGKSWTLRIPGGEALEAPWVERRNEHIVYPATYPGIDAIISVADRHASVLFVIADEKATRDLSLVVGERDDALRLRDMPVLDSRGEGRAPDVRWEGDRINLHFDPKGLQYPLLATIELELFLEEPATTGLRWALAQETWPGPHANSPMTYDADRGRVVLEGDNDERSVWEYDGTRWSRLRPTAQSAHPFSIGIFDRAAHVSVFPPGRQSETWTLGTAPAKPR